MIQPIEIIHGDSLAVLPQRLPDSIDSIVTDPPYGLEFMGKEWDHGVPGVPFWVEALRVAKPGAHLLAFGGTRTHHRLMCAIEDAGWEIRDCLMWLYGSGFPKSLDVSKAIEAHIKTGRSDSQVTGDGRSRLPGQHFSEFRRGTGPTAEFVPTTVSAKQWQGWGTALKPAWEPIILARKPLIGTVAVNVQTYGCGGLNIDGCRIQGPEPHHNYGRTSGSNSFVGEGPVSVTPKSGRWPANLILDESAAAMLGEPSRFFYCAKANKKDRGEDNNHPTVKPTDLMRYLVRLVTPPGGTILDPFMGSGSTGKAAILERFGFVGVDLSSEYCEIAKRRCAVALCSPELVAPLDKGKDS